MRPPKRAMGTAADTSVIEKLLGILPSGAALASSYLRTAEHVIARLNAELEIARLQRDPLAKGVLRAAKTSGELDLPIVAEIQKWWKDETVSYRCDGCSKQVPWALDTCPSCLRLLVLR